MSKYLPLCGLYQENWKYLSTEKISEFVRVIYILLFMPYIFLQSIHHPTDTFHDTLFVTYINPYIFRHQDALHYSTRYHTLRMVYVDEIFSDHMELRLTFVCFHTSCTYKKQLSTDNRDSLL
jgi:FlaA1/EpsC-like NDP-sugar epimerase